MSNTGGINLGYDRVVFTWSNKRVADSIIKERLDRVKTFGSEQSDHSPLVLDTIMDRDEGPTLFHFLCCLGLRSELP